MILSYSMYDKTYLHECLASSNIHSISKWLDLLFKTLHQERKKKWKNSYKACMGTLSCGPSPPICIHLMYIYFYIKTLIIMSISTNINKIYVCDPLGLYILLVNKYIG